MNLPRLVVFAKEPQRGRVKTRLSGVFPDEALVGLYKAFCRDTVDLARQARCGVRVLAYESAGSAPRFLKSIAGDFIFQRQQGKDLGARIDALVNSGKTVIIGSDSPDLPPRLIDDAFRRLEDFDVVLGPACDGGFYLVGLKKSCSFLWRGVKWGTSDVLTVVSRNAAMRGMKVSLLKRWADVDDAVLLDRLLRRLKGEKNAAPATRRFLRCLL